MTRREPSSRPAQQAAVLYAVMAGLVLVVSLQWVLLTVAVEGFLRKQGDLLSVVTLASGACFAAACWLIRQAPGRHETRGGKGASRT